MTEPINVTPSSIDSSHRLLAILSHGALFLGAPILIPLIVYLVSKNDRSIVSTHAAEALNFHLSFTIWALLCVPLVFLFGLGAFLIGALAISTFILAIIGLVKAANDEIYRYPLTLRLVGELPPRKDVVRDI
ncbi:MAG: DUF4870 domain-containing protein [Synoicihabitans sp.]